MVRVEECADEDDDHETASDSSTRMSGLRMTGIDGHGQRNGESTDCQNAALSSMTSTAAANSQPDHDPTDVADQPSRDTMDPLRTKDRADEGGCDCTESKHPAEHVATCARDSHRDQHSDRICDSAAAPGSRSEQVDRKAPTPNFERKRHAQSAVRIPERKMALMDLHPRLIGERNEESDLSLSTRSCGPRRRAVR